jgi:CheY-like chemotaxis protein
MAPENANIFIVEDNEDRIEKLTEILKDDGHKVVDIAKTRAEALKKIPELGENKVNITIMDGNLTKDDICGNDGEEFTREIKARYPNIIVIGNSNSDHVRGADFNYPKKKGVEKLLETITQA